jgi:hypothetical protein
MIRLQPAHIDHAHSFAVQWRGGYRPIWLCSTHIGGHRGSVLDRGRGGRRANDSACPKLDASENRLGRA